jgi:hypothetical protein
MRKDLHKQLKELVNTACGNVGQPDRRLRSELRRVNPFSYKTEPYWYRIFLKYRNRAFDKMNKAQATKQMKLFDEDREDV